MERLQYDETFFLNPDLDDQVRPSLESCVPLAIAGLPFVISPQLDEYLRGCSTWEMDMFIKHRADFADEQDLMDKLGIERGGELAPGM